MNNGVQFRDIIQDLIIEGKILLDKLTAMRIDNEPFPAHIVEVNWPERRNKRKINIDIGKKGTRKVTLKTPIRPKATIIAGIVMCSRCKCECDLEIPTDNVKINEQLVRHEKDKTQSLNRPALESYGPFNPKVGLEDSYDIFHGLGSIRNIER
ncbi:unnamed protein product [Prunus armeniaca]